MQVESLNASPTQKADWNLRADVRSLSLKIKHAQREIRVLSSIRWSAEFEQKFLAQEGAPSFDGFQVGYEMKELRFQLPRTLSELSKLRNEVDSRLEETPECQRILRAMIDDYSLAARMISNRGRPEFGEISEKLWGSPQDLLPSGDLTLFQYTENFKHNLENFSDEQTERMFPKVLSAEAMASLLKQKLNEAHLLEQVDVRLSDTLTSDAAAGSDYLKIRKGAFFSIKDVDVFLYHEAFTHIATALNGRNQPFAKWLGFDSPRCTSTQEGLAVLMEMLSGRTYPRRLRRIVDRVLIVGMIHEGQTPTHVYDFLRTNGYSHKEALVLILRAYRGSDPHSHRPFTKDISYMKGLVECFNFIQVALGDQRYDAIHALYCGKLAISEVPSILKAMKRGIVEKPKWIPSLFLDLDTLSGWFTYVTALGGLGNAGLREKFRQQNALD